MTDRDSWWATHKDAPPTPSGGGFTIAPEAVPAVTTAFQEAVVELAQARQVMTQLQFLLGEEVNPVVDRFLAALGQLGSGDHGSVTLAVNSAISEYHNVLDQLNSVAANYQANEDSAVDAFKRSER